MILDKDLLSLLAQIPAIIFALLALLTSLRSQAQVRAKEIALREKEIEIEAAKERRESDISLAMTTNQAAMQALITKQIADNTNFSRQLMGLTADHNSELHARTQVATIQTAVLEKQSSALEKQSAATEMLTAAFKQDVAAIITHLEDTFTLTVNHAAEQMRASRQATDTQLSSIKANTEYGNQAIDATTQVVQKLGQAASSDHQRILAAADQLSKQIESLPTYLVKSLAPVIDELRTATQHLRDTEAQLLKVVTAVVPPPPREVALESTPQAERDTRAIADLRAALGKAEVDR